MMIVYRKQLLPQMPVEYTYILHLQMCRTNN